MSGVGSVDRGVSLLGGRVGRVRAKANIRTNSLESRETGLVSDLSGVIGMSCGRARIRGAGKSGLNNAGFSLCVGKRGIIRNGSCQGLVYRSSGAGGGRASGSSLCGVC